MNEIRTKVVFLMIFLYLGGMISPLKDFAGHINQGISIWTFPILMNDLVCSFIVFCFWCFLICDAPFRNEGYLYFAGRAGKRNWIYGELLFLFIFSGIYILVVNFFLLLHSLPKLTLTMEWGKTLGTLAYTDAASQFAIPFSLPATMMSSMSPVTATVLSFILAWWIAFLLALSIFAINWCLKTSLGVVFGLFWVFLDLTVYNVLDGVWWRYSPVTFAKISMLTGRYSYLTPEWAILFLTCTLLILLLLIFVYTRIRKGIE